MPLQYLESCFAHIAMLEINLAQKNFIHFADRAQRIPQNRPPQLKDLVLAGRKRPSGKPGCRRRDRLAFQSREVLPEDSSLLELAGIGCDARTSESELEKGGGGLRVESCRLLNLTQCSELHLAGWNLQPGTRCGKRQHQLLVLAQRLRLEAKLTQGLREISRETVKRIDFLRLNALHEFNQIGKINMVAQRKCRV